ncbi:GNAT family N-acetyltransferase [Mycobacterium sp. NPDC003449]
MADMTLTALAEGAEAEVMYQYETLAPPPTKSALGIATVRIGGGVALAMRNDPVGYWNKALGFGFAEPVTADLVRRVTDFYRAERSAGAVLQIAPAALPDAWPEICAEFGISFDSEWIKLACPVEEVEPAAPAGVDVGPVEPADVDEWASATLRGFGMPTAGLAEMMVACTGNPAFRPFAAWEGGEIVAAANLFVHGEIGALNAGATLDGYRTRGLHSALIAARAKEAARTGCRWLVAETAKPGGGEVNHSLNNLLRTGLRPLYTRQNWIWTPKVNCG